MMVPGKMTPCQSREAVVTVLSYAGEMNDGGFLGQSSKSIRLSKSSSIWDRLQNFSRLPSRGCCKKPSIIPLRYCHTATVRSEERRVGKEC